MHDAQQLLVEAVAAAKMVVDGREIRARELADLLARRRLVALGGDEPARAHQEFFARGLPVFPLYLFHTITFLYQADLWRKSQPAAGIVTAATASIGMKSKPISAKPAPSR